MDDADRRLLSETHGAVMEMKGTIPHLATKNDLSTAIRTHEKDRHSEPERRERRKINNLKGKLFAGLVALVAAATAALSVLAAK